MKYLDNVRFLFFLFFFVGWIGGVGFSQSIENVKKQLNGDEIIITYDLISPDPRLNFDIRLYGSIEGRRERLFRATGDVGRDIQGGKNKELRWSNDIEFINVPLERIKFDLTFQFLDPPVKMLKPISNVEFKRGKTYELRWLGGERVSIDLYQGNQKVRTIAYAQEGGSFSWRIPGSLKPGNNYYVEIYGDRRKGIVKSKEFSIKRRYPTWVKVIPIIGIGAGAAVLISSGDDGGEEVLPAPINPN